MKGSQVTIDHVSKKFGDFVALDDINFTIKPGEFFSLLGPSGCGKTTLLRIIAGFEFPDDGIVLFDDKNVIPLNPDKRESNTVFQTYALFPHMTVYENVAFSLRLKKLPKDGGLMAALRALSRAAKRPAADRTGFVIFTADDLLRNAVPEKKRALCDKCDTAYMLHREPGKNPFLGLLNRPDDKDAVVNKRVSLQIRDIRKRKLGHGFLPRKNQEPAVRHNDVSVVLHSSVFTDIIGGAVPYLLSARRGKRLSALRRQIKFQIHNVILPAAAQHETTVLCKARPADACGPLLTGTDPAFSARLPTVWYNPVFQNGCRQGR